MNISLGRDKFIRLKYCLKYFQKIDFDKYLKAKRNKENNHTQWFSQKHKASLKERVIESHNFTFAIFRFYQICFSINLKSFEIKGYTSFINICIFESPKDSHNLLYDQSIQWSSNDHKNGNAQLKRSPHCYYVIYILTKYEVTKDAANLHKTLNWRIYDV